MAVEPVTEVIEICDPEIENRMMFHILVYSCIYEGDLKLEAR